MSDKGQKALLQPLSWFMFVKHFSFWPTRHKTIHLFSHILSSAFVPQPVPICYSPISYLAFSLPRCPASRRHPFRIGWGVYSVTSLFFLKKSLVGDMGNLADEETALKTHQSNNNKTNSQLCSVVHTVWCGIDLAGACSGWGGIVLGQGTNPSKQETSWGVADYD